MTTSISSEDVWNDKKYVWVTGKWNRGRENSISMFLPFVAWPTDRRTNIHKIDAYTWEEYAEKKLVVCFN